MSDRTISAVVALACALAVLVVLSPRAQDSSAMPVISAERILAHTRHLASDELEGRAPASHGETLTIRYLSEQLDALGIEPGNPRGGWLQEVPLVGTTVTNDPELVVAGASGGLRSIRLRYGTDFVAWTLRRRPLVTIEDAEMVFVGYGIVAPEYRWDDFKDVDLAGKVVVMLVGDPPHPDRSLFAGPAMTYYGRWTYKFEIAAARGAAAAILVHTPDEAGYPWAVVANSWTGEQFDMIRSDAGASRCMLESWISSASAEKLFAATGGSLAQARREALSRDFRPRPLGLNATVRLRSEERVVRSHNVVGMLPAANPRHRGEHIVYTAHWDHLGRGAPVDGDSIYNGALDNASGVAGVLEIARAFAAVRRDLERSVLFIFTTAEEGGLLGARHYVENPLYPLEAAVAAINVDGLNVWGRTSDIVVIGHGQSDLDRYLEAHAGAQHRRLRPDTAPEKGYYYRSDHFAFAQKGVPALYAEGGVQLRGRPEGWGAEVREQYLLRRYHKPQDEVDPAWDLTGAVEDLELLFRVGLELATTAAYPKWSESSEFKNAGDRGSGR